MALVRILVDGYSLIHQWPQLAPGKPRHSAAAREELIHFLTLYQDMIGTPITIVFDGGGAPPGTPKTETSGRVEILFSRNGQTADQVIERVTHLLRPYGEVMAVTDDNLERETVIALGGMASNCQNFIYSVHAILDEVERDIKSHNQRERNAFKSRA